MTDLDVSLCLAEGAAGPSDEELEAMFGEALLRLPGDSLNKAVVEYARAVLARFGAALASRAATLLRDSAAPPPPINSEAAELVAVFRRLVEEDLDSVRIDPELLASAAGLLAQLAKPQKERPDFLVGYRAGLHDGRLEAESRASERLPSLAGEGPSDEDVLRLAAEATHIDDIFDAHAEGYPLEVTTYDLLAFASAFLARFGNTPPRPVPVSERLPEMEDCDAQERCWQEETGTNSDPPAWILVHRVHVVERGCGRWLPAHALPVPEVTK